MAGETQVWLPGQVKFAPWQVWWSREKVKLASVVFLVLISNQNQFQILRLQDEQWVESMV